MPFLVIDVGGDDLEVEVNSANASIQFDKEGVRSRRAAGGALLTTVTYDPKLAHPFTTKWLTDTEYQALVAAAQYPETIVVGGDAIRPLTTLSCQVEISAVPL